MELYRRPRNVFVAGFIGSPAMNLIGVTLSRSGRGLVVRNPAGLDLPLNRDFPGLPDEAPAQLGVRPENLTVGSEADAVLHGRVEVVECLGELTIVYLDVGGAEPVVVKLSGEHEFDHGERLSVTCGMSSMHLFAEDGTTLANGLE